MGGAAVGMRCGQQGVSPLWVIVSLLSLCFWIFFISLFCSFFFFFFFQVNYVLQEDLGVLSALPGHTFSLLHLLASDLCSWIGSAADLLLGVGETGFSNVYYCTSSMLGALFSSCYTGVTGLGTLAGDTVGVFGEALDNGWWVTKFFGGRLWDNSEGYVVSVASELGGQTKAVGGGLWKLVWRCGSGVCNVFHLGGGVIFGILDLLIGTVSEAFGQESSSEEGLESVLKS